MPWRRKITTHSSILAWRVPRIEEPGGLQSMELQRIRHNWTANLAGRPLANTSFHTHQLIPSFISPGFFKKYLEIMESYERESYEIMVSYEIMGESTCPISLLMLYFQARELPLFSTNIYKVSKVLCPFAFRSSALLLSCPTPGRHTINTTYPCWRFLAFFICPFLLLGIPLQDSAHPWEIYSAPLLALLLTQTS